MFDFAFSEIALIGVVALIAIGPKDMPVAIRAISTAVKKLRRMAGEFQGHVDEMIREADLGDVKESFDEIRRLNPRSMVQRAIDPDGSVKSAFADPFRDRPVLPVRPALDQPQPLLTLDQIRAARPAATGEPAPALDQPEASPPVSTEPAPHAAAQDQSSRAEG